jgi:HlyD family type I secretion membrane fusion protein
VAISDEVHAPQPSANWRSVVRWGHGVIVGGLGVFLLWTLIARLDAAAVATGVVSVESNRKTIQHLEGGIVREILVHDGDMVKEGQVLVRLDPTRADAMADLNRNQLLILLAQEARLIAERDRADKITFPPEVVAQQEVPVVARAMSDQQRQFDGRRDTVLRNVQVAEAQIAQTVKDQEQNQNESRTARATLATVTQEFEAVRALYAKNLVALPRMTAIEREKLRLEGVISDADITALKLTEKVQELTLRRDQAWQDYRQDALNQLSDMRKTISDLRQQIIVADDAQRRVDVRAPTAGTVQQMRIFTVGGVVKPGDPILDLVPASDTLIVQARISPLDADRVSAGMMAQIRFPSFRSFGVKIIQGQVRSVSRDRLLDEVTHDPYFAAEIGVDRASLPPELVDKLTAGMPAEAVIPTGERTAFRYLISPLVERFQTAMRER